MAKIVFKKESKYRAKATVIDNVRFASQKEGAMYVKLKAMQAAGEILYFLMQVPFYLPGGVKYVCDFVVVCVDETLRYVDVKGFKTPVYILKKKQVEALYPVKIEEEFVL